jgi:hypothetical protein
MILVRFSDGARQLRFVACAGRVFGIALPVRENMSFHGHLKLSAVDTASRYQTFSTQEARGKSRCYEEWAAGIGSDNDLLALIETLPESRQQPNLILASARWVGIVPGPYSEFRNEFIMKWDEIRAIAMARRTQTNEVGRCAALLPVLCELPQPLALLEVGASAGLCLYPDQYNYQYNDDIFVRSEDNPSGPLLRCSTTGNVPFPTRTPHVVWRRGIDLNPLDVGNREDMQWLETLVWPEQNHRRERLEGAIQVARANPPTIVRGDLLDELEETSKDAPSDATLVIFHSAVLNYLSQTARSEFCELVGGLPAHWISNEGVGVVDFQGHELPSLPDSSTSMFVAALDGTPLAYTGPHGERLDWF